MYHKCKKLSMTCFHHINLTQKCCDICVPKPAISLNYHRNDCLRPGIFICVLQSSTNQRFIATN